MKQKIVQSGRELTLVIPASVWAAIQKDPAASASYTATVTQLAGLEKPSMPQTAPRDTFTILHILAAYKDLEGGVPRQVLMDGTTHLTTPAKAKVWLNNKITHLRFKGWVESAGYALYRLTDGGFKAYELQRALVTGDLPKVPALGRVDSSTPMEKDNTIPAPAPRPQQKRIRLSNPPPSISPHDVFIAADRGYRGVFKVGGGRYVFWDGLSSRPAPLEAVVQTAHSLPARMPLPEGALEFALPDGTRISWNGHAAFPQKVLDSIADGNQLSYKKLVR